MDIIKRKGLGGGGGGGGGGARNQMDSLYGWKVQPLKIAKLFKTFEELCIPWIGNFQFFNLRCHLQDTIPSDG